LRRGVRPLAELLAVRAMSDALVGPLPTITFYGAGDVRVTQAYDVPRDTRDLRAQLCVEHHPACDCREALLNENLTEHISEWRHLNARRTDTLCLCSGCVIARANLSLIGSRGIDLRTGRVK